MYQVAKTALCLTLFFSLSGWSRAAVPITQDSGADYIAWEAESQVTIVNGTPATWAIITDANASGGFALQEQGAGASTLVSTSYWTLVFNMAGTYQLYIKYMLDPCCGANSYRFPQTFGPNPNFLVSRANENGTGPTFYTVIKEREQNQTAVFATYTVAPADVGNPLIFAIGNREIPGLRIDRLVLSTNLDLDASGNVAFDALRNSSGGPVLQDIGANYIAWEAETHLTIVNGTNATWGIFADTNASGGFALQEQGIPVPNNDLVSTSFWSLVFQLAGTYNMYIKYRLDPNNTGPNSYRFPDNFGPTPNFKVSRANENNTTTTYTVIREREQNQTAVFATFTVAPGDVGNPLTFAIGNRETPGLTIDRIALSTDPSLDVGGNGNFDALINSSGGSILFPNPGPIKVDSRLNPNGVRVTYRAPMTASALDPANYTLDQGVSVTSASYVGNGSNIIQLTVSPSLILGSNYMITVSGVSNIDGLVISPNPLTTNFLHGAGLNQPAGLTVKIYNGANNLALIKNAVANCATPTFQSSTANVGFEYTTSERSAVVDGNTFSQGNTENYGTWIYGEFVPPTTGNYQFALSSDDNSELYLSSDASPANKVLLTAQTAWNGYRGYISGNGNAPPPLPAPVSLVAGRRYYMEVVVQEGGGGDHVSVTVRKPGDPAIADNQLPIPRSMFATNYSLGCPPAFFFENLGPITQAIAPTSQTVNERFNATFLVGADGTPPYVFQWYSNGVAIAGASNATYTFQTLRYADGSQYYAVMANDFSSVTSSVATLTVISDTNPPTLFSAYGNGVFTNATVVFSEPVETASGLNLANYTITNSSGAALAVLSASLRDGSNVVLRTDPQTPGERYTVVVNNVGDRAGVANVIAANSTISFTAWVFSPGFALMEVYGPITGTTIAQLTNNPSYPFYPREQYYLTSSDSRLAYPNDSHDNYGGRISGLFIPPTDGTNIFRISRDDDARLRGSTNENPANAQTIINVACCDNTFAAASPPIFLTGGTRNYYELLWKEGGGGDYGRLSIDGVNTIPSSLLGVYANPDAVSLVITQQPQSQTRARNSFATFTVGVSFASFDGASRAVLYQWRSNGVDIAGANGSNYTTPQLNLSDDGEVFSVLVRTPGATLLSSNATLTVIDDTNGPSLVRIRTDAGFRTIYLTYDELIDSGAAGEIGNYNISDPSMNALAVNTIDYGGSNVVLHVDPMQPGTVYNLIIDFQADLAGNPSVPEEIITNVLTWTITPGLTFFQAFYGLPSGQNIGQFVAMPIYPNGDTFHFYTNIVYWPQTANPNVEQYVMRFSGLFIAPETGTFIFDPAHDDDVRLRVSSNEDPANASANELAGGCCSGLNDGATLSVAMVADQRYYYELIVREYGGGDYAGIRVTAPTLGTRSPLDRWTGLAIAPENAENSGIAQQPQSQTIQANHVATFSVVVTNSSGTSYQWQANTGSGFTNIPGALSASYTTGYVPLSGDGTLIRVIAFTIGRNLTSSNATLTVVTDPDKPLALSAHGNRSFNGIRIVFNEAMDAATSTETSNYSLTDSNNAAVPLGTPVLSADLTTVTIPSDPLAQDAVYIVSISGVADAAGNTIVPTNLAFRTWIVSPGFLIRDFFYGTANPPNNLALFTNDARYPNSPSFVDHFSQYAVNPNLGDSGRENYGARVSGYLVPPVTGNYKFRLLSDDGGALWLSTNSAPSNMVQVIFADGDCGGCGGPVSAATYSLQAGERYYTEAIFEEGTGGDYIVISGSIDGVNYVPITGLNLASLADPVGASITITQQPVSVITNPASQVTFSVGASAQNEESGSNPPRVYQWSRNNGSGWNAIPGASSASYSFTAQSSDNGAQFRADIYIPGASATSAAATLTTGQPSISIVRSGSQVTISWSGPFCLQETSSLDGTPVWGSSSVANGVPFTPGPGNTFYRLTNNCP